MYNEDFHPQVKKDVKKLDKKVQIKVRNELLDKILKDPFKYEELEGSFKGIRSYHFKMNRVEYRIAYIVYKQLKKVYFLRIGVRENFYDILERRL